MVIEISKYAFNVKQNEFLLVQFNSSGIFIGYCVLVINMNLNQTKELNVVSDRCCILF